MKTTFGLDLAGYAGGNSGFARADLGIGERIQVTVYEGHVFGKRLKGSDPLGNLTKGEQQILKACCEIGDVLVDTPVDLQGLPSPSSAYFTWELVKRPVDYAFDALAPLANLIGAPVARFQHMLRAFRETVKDGALGEVFETYPAASLKLLGLWSSGYGNRRANFAKGCWQGGALADILNELGVEAEEGMMLDGDEFDALICAVTGLVDVDRRFMGHELSLEVLRRIREKVPEQHHAQISSVVPENYVLMKSWPDAKICVSRERLDDPEKIPPEGAI